MKKLKLTFVLMAMLLLFVACSSKSDGNNSETTENDGNAEDSDIDVGFVIRTQDSPYYVTLAEKVKEHGEEQGWNVDILDSNGDITKEADGIASFVSQGKDLIFVDAIEPSPVVPHINSAAEVGIPIINLDSGVDDDANDVTTIYSDNKENGRLVGLAYGEEIGDEEIKAILLSGEKGSIAGQERRTGLLAGIIEARTDLSEEAAWEEAEEFENTIMSKGKGKHEDAKIEIVGQGWGAWTKSEGLDAATDLITANPDITAILGENDQMLFGAMTALENAEIDNVDMVAGADGAHEAMDLIKEGKYFATGLNSPSLVAEKGVDIAKEILVDGQDPSSYDKITLTEPVAVTKDNVDDYYDLGF